jgi:D-arabinose 1-dehydrogenase-like Zn-dependent alcohol dehydrogenase
MAPGGRVVVVGNLDTGSFELNPGLVIVKELEIIGAYATTRDELDTALQLTAAGHVKSCVSEVLPLADAASVHSRLEKRQISGRVVLVPPAL